MNILLTCIGRRDYMVEYFRDALAGRGLVIAANSEAETAGMATADVALVVPPIKDPAYVDSVVSICREHAVALVVPLLDQDALILSKARERLAEVGAILASPSTKAVEVCVDKWETHLLAGRIDERSPMTFLDLEEARVAIREGQLRLPVIVKPRWGIGSIGIHVVEKTEDLARIYTEAKTQADAAYFSQMASTDHDRNVLIQEMIEGTEYGLDVFNDLSGNFAACLVKEKLDMRAGETDRARTVESARLEAVGQRISEALQHIGNLDVDVIVRDGIPYILEFNPRFGGHYPFSHIAGANLPAALISMVGGEDPNPAWLRIKPGVLGVKGIKMVVVG